MVCVVEVGTSSNYRLGLVFRSRFRSTKERVTTPVLGLYVDLGFNSCVVSCVVLLTMTSARLFVCVMYVRRDKKLLEMGHNVSKRKVNCTLVQALRFCTGRTAHRASRGIALLIHDQRH
jgi:hypothetical protein